MEAAPRFELGNKGFADLCLTTWLCRPLTSIIALFLKRSKEIKWSGRRDLNPRPPPWQGGVLPLNYFRSDGAETQNRTGDTRIFSPLLYQLSYLGVATPNGLEPSTSCVTGRRSNQLNYGAVFPYQAVLPASGKMYLSTSTWSMSTDFLSLSVPVLHLCRQQRA